MHGTRTGVSIRRISRGISPVPVRSLCQWGGSLISLDLTGVGYKFPRKRSDLDYIEPAASLSHPVGRSLMCPRGETSRKAFRHRQKMSDSVPQDLWRAMLVGNKLLEPQSHSVVDTQARHSNCRALLSTYPRHDGEKRVQSLTDQHVVTSGGKCNTSFLGIDRINPFLGLSSLATLNSNHFTAGQTTVRSLLIHSRPSLPLSLPSSSPSGIHIYSSVNPLLAFPLLDSRCAKRCEAARTTHQKQKHTYSLSFRRKHVFKSHCPTTHHTANAGDNVFDTSTVGT